MVTMLEIVRLLIICNFATIIYGQARHIHKDVGESCKTFEDRDGACTVFVECKSIYNIVRHDKSYFNQIIQCNFIGASPVICCPDVTPNSTLVKLPSTPHIIVPNISGTDERIYFEDDYVLIEATSKTNTNVTAPTSNDIKDRFKVGNKAERECIKYRAPRIIYHIIGGSMASIGEFPHMAGLGWLSAGSEQTYKFLCGGSLISPNFIMTAAHCVDNDTARPTIVRLGKVAINSIDNHSEGVDVEISEFIIHDQYNPPQKYHDIALLRLVKSLNFNNVIRPACLYPRQDDVGEDVQLWACGWGKINEREQTSEVLLKTNLTRIPLQTCKEIYGNISNLPSIQLPRGIQENQLCAHDQGEGRDTCDGDSGGPLEIMDDPLQSTIYGIVSFGYGCNQSKPGVYVRVAHYIEWIEKIVWP